MEVGLPGPGGAQSSEPPDSLSCSEAMFMTVRRCWSITLILAAGAGSACAGASDPGVPDAEVSIIPGAVAQGSSGFTPNPLVRNIADGSRVTWKNGDWVANPAGGASGTAHYLISDEGLFESGSVPPKQSFSFVFPGPGTYRYHCLNHPTMTGVITIAP